MRHSPTSNNQHSFFAHAALLLMTAVALVCCSINGFWGTSIDFAHHYALIARLSELQFNSSLFDPSLGEMNYYPRNGHILAAIMGRIFGSAFLGMHIVSLLSVILFWSSISFMLLSLPRKAAYFSAMILATLLWANQHYFHVELHAVEIIGNYFFAQLLGQACVIFVVCVLLFFDRIATHARYFFLVASIYLIVGIHLLPALELFAFFILLTIVEQYQVCKSKQASWRSMVSAILLLAIAGTVLISHPSFVSMRAISANNGVLNTHYLNDLGTLSLLNVALIFCSGFFLRFWLTLNSEKQARSLIIFKYVGLYGLSMAGLCLMQILALKFGQGSEYAIKKYVFGLQTVLFIDIVLLLMLLVYKTKKSVLIEKDDDSDKSIASIYLLPITLTSIAYFCVIPNNHALATFEITTLEQKLLLRRDLMVVSIPDKFNYVAGINALPQNISYMMSIGIFKSPRTFTPKSSSGSWWIDDWNKIGTLVTSENSPLDSSPECHRTTPANSLALLDGECLAKLRVPRSHILFTRNEEFSTCTSEGMGQAEEFGTWTIQKKVSIRCQIPQQNKTLPSKLEIETSGFLDHVTQQRVLVNVKNQSPVEYTFNDQKPNHLMKLTLPNEKSNEVQIEFSLPDAISPKQLGIGEDARRLGISIKSITFK